MTTSRTGDAPAFFGIAALLVVLAWVLAFVNLFTAGMALFPIPVAYYLSCKAPWRAAALVVAAALAGLAASNGVPETALRYALVAGIGVPMGLGFARRWTYGWILSVTVAYVLILMAAVLSTNWDTWVNESDAGLLMLKSYSETTNNKELDAETAYQISKAFDWMRAHWVSIGLGMVFCQALFGIAVAQWLTAWWLGIRRCGRARNRFRTMRTPDWAVWLVIGCAGLWFADHYWSVPWAQLVSWNGLIALAAVYWLNGLSVLLYAAAVLRPHPAMIMLFFAVLFLARTGFVLLISIGLFDTWGEFRRKIDRLAAFRRISGPKDDDAP